MVLAAVLCSASSVSALHIADACIPAKISIQGTTNYNTDNRIIVEISPVDFAPTSKTGPQSLGGAAATVEVQEGTGLNYWEMSANTAGWQPGMYLVQASIIGKEFVESEFIMLGYCTDSTQNTHGDESAVRNEMAPSSATEISPSPSVTDGIGASAAPTSFVNEAEPSEVLASPAEPQSTPRSPSWFGIAVLACLGACLIWRR